MLKLTSRHTLININKHSICNTGEDEFLGVDFFGSHK